MEQRYHIHYSGEVLDGHNVADVRAKLGKLFNADAVTLDKLFSGSRQAVKRNCDKATALKYKKAMENAGAKPVITAAPESTPATDASTASTTQPATQAQNPPSAPELTKAERIAAIAAGSDEPAGKVSSVNNHIEDSDQSAPAFDVAATGADLLRPEERPAVEPANVDTSAIELTATGSRLSDEPPPPPAAPDTTHLSMGSVGEVIPNLKSSVAELQPDTSSIDLAPSGTDFSDCASDDPEPLDLDLSGLDLAPDGSDLLEAKYRDQHSASAPATDHLSLE
ncbi:MAG: hypothetical protein ABJ013_02320 [Halioglobus sp.]